MAKKTIAQLSQKGLNVAIKNNATIGSLCFDYSCSEDQLLEKIKSLYRRSPAKARVRVDLLRSREKRVLRHATRRDAAMRLPEDSTAVSEAVKPVKGVTKPVEIPETMEPAKATVVTNPVETSEITEPVETSEITEAVEATETQKDTLESLKEHEKAVEVELAKINNMVRLYSCKLRETRGGYSAIYDGIKKLQEKLRDLKGEYERLSNEEASILRELTELAGQITMRQNYLEKIRSEIAELEMINIFVCTNGEIVSECADTPIATEVNEKLFDRLIRNEACSDLKVWEIRTLCRVLISRVRASRKLKFVFENPAMEAAYNSIIDA